MENDVFDTLREQLENKQFAAFRAQVSEMSEVDVAAFLELLPDELLLKAFRLIAKDMAADVFSYLPPDVCAKLIEHASGQELGTLIEDLYVDDAVDLLGELPAGMVSKIMKQAKPETRALINKFLAYPEDSAGSVMTAEFLTLHMDQTVGEAISKIRRQGADKETVHVVYVTDARRVLEGTLDLSDLLFAAPETPLADIVDTNVVSATTTEDKESVAAKISRYNLLALPVVDSENRLVGIVTVDDALDVMEEEATEDIEKMAAITPTDKPYLKTGVFATYLKRIPWLLLLMISATFTGAIITHYENALGAYVVLTAFIPMLMDTGGNAGGQASVTIIRGLSLGDIRLRDILRVLGKELRVSVLCGLSLSVVTFGKLMLFDRVGLTVALVVSLTMLAAVVVAKIIGSSLPILAKRLGFDPAVMASPFITTIVDALSLLIYFRIACSMLNI